MKRRLLSLLIIATFATVAMSLSGCQMVRKKLGITTEVSTSRQIHPHARTYGIGMVRSVGILCTDILVTVAFV